MTCRYARVDGLRLEPVGHIWVAFSPLSGETVLLNDESASVLEILESGVGTTESIAATLASDTGLDTESVGEVILGSWQRLVEGGLVRELRDGHSPPQ